MENTEREEKNELNMDETPSQTAEPAPEAENDAEANEETSEAATTSGEEEETAEEGSFEKKKKRVCPRLTRGQPPKLDKRTVALLLLIMILYSLLAFFRIGTTEIPQTSIYLDKKGQSVTVKLDEPSEVSRFCLYKWRGRKNDITIETKLNENDDWWVAYGPKQLSSHMRWKNLDLDTEGLVQYIRITFKGKEITLAELVVLDENGEKLPISVPKSLNKKLSDKDKLDRLTDEQDIFDEDSASLTYAYFDEYLYALTSNAYIHGGTGLENTHPALGKVLMSLGIRIFGMNPIGWRFFGTLSGILMLPVMFFLARRVLRDNRWALVATYLMSVECMHYTQTRLATIDSFPLLFILLAYLNMMKYYQAEEVSKEKGPLFLSGLCFGLACAFKWIGAYAGVGLAICFFIFFISKARAYREADEEFSIAGYTVKTFLYCVLTFVILPVAVYTVSYMPVAFSPYDEINGWKGIWENQIYMWNFHSTLEQTFDFSSKWWGWPIMKGGFTSYSGTAANGMKARILVTGNPMVWWVSVPAILYAIVYFVGGRRVRTPLIKNEKITFRSLISEEKADALPASVGLERFDSGLLLAFVAYLCQYVPWMLVTRECFIYHYFASAELSILAITFALRVIERKFASGRGYVRAYCILTGLVFIGMFPILNGFFIPAKLMKLLETLII